MTRNTLVLSLALLLPACGAQAAEYKVGSIEISNPWARATPKGAEVGGAYMTIMNKGSAADRLIGGSSPAAAHLEIHRMTMEGGVMRMRPVTGGLEIKPGATVEFKPQSYHVMLIGLTHPLENGHPVKATLQFERAGKIDIEYQVEAMGATHGGSMAPMNMKQDAAPIGTMQKK
jgi:hypothetical protein